MHRVFITKILTIFLFLSSLSLLNPKNINAQFIGNWTEESSLPFTNASHQMFSYNSSLYIIGGAGDDGGGDVFHSEVLKTSIQNGSLSSWIVPSNLPEKIAWHNVATKQNRIFVLGGLINPSQNNYKSIKKVYSALIDNNGNFSNWTELTELPQESSLGGTFIFNDWIYYIGGVNRVNSSYQYHNQVLRAKINNDNTIGNWVELQPLPQPKSSFSTFIYGNFVYIIGGELSRNQLATNTVLRAVIDAATGNISSWQQLDPLPTLSHRPGHFEYNNSLYILGGYNGSSVTNLIYSAKLNTDGSLSPWKLNDVQIPSPKHAFPALTKDNNVYISGGAGGGYTNKVYRISFPPDGAILPVTQLLQASPPWGSQEYDTAHKWSNNPTIDRWGCALTSASMVLQYYGHNINPDGLNSWLNSQPDGYLRNGSLNWLAVSRYTKIHDTASSPSLEFRRYGANNTTLENELNNQRPIILSFPGHFVVAKGKNDIDFLVNDPQSASNQTISDVSASTGGSYSAIDSFIPSHTNLSYILLAASGNTNLKVFDNHGDEITGFTYSEAPLIDDLNKADTSGESLTIFAYPTPAEGIYQVTLSGQDTQLDSFLYDIDGNVTENHLEDNQSNDDQNFLINIGEDQKIVEINYKTLITTLDNSYKEGLISSFRVYRNIRSLILTSEFFSVHRHGRSKIPQLFLGIASKTVKFYTPTFIEESTSNLLLKEIEILKTQI